MAAKKLKNITCRAQRLSSCKKRGGRMLKDDVTTRVTILVAGKGAVELCRDCAHELSRDGRMTEWRACQLEKAGNHAEAADIRWATWWIAFHKEHGYAPPHAGNQEDNNGHLTEQGEAGDHALGPALRREPEVPGPAHPRPPLTNPYLQGVTQ